MKTEARTPPSPGKALGVAAQGSGLRVQSGRFGGQGFGFGVRGKGLGVSSSLEFRVQGFGFWR